MLTLNQLKKQIVDYFKNHLQVNTVIVGSDEDANSKTDINYPLVQIETGDSKFNGNYYQYTFKIVIADLLAEDSAEFEDEIYNDVILIANDFINKFSISKDYTLNKNINIQPFRDSRSDRTSGIVFFTSFTIIRDLSTCNQPIKAS